MEVGPGNLERKGKENLENENRRSGPREGEGGA